jgi:hypothetical protein
MLRNHEALVVTDVDRKTALRLLSAVVIGWDTIPAAVRGRLVQDSCLIDGDGTALSFPASVLAFIAKHKDRPPSDKS